MHRLLFLALIGLALSVGCDSAEDSDDGTLPVLLAPAAGAQFANAETITFTWQPVEGATRQRVEIAREEGFGQVIATIVRTPQSGSATIQGYEAGEYYWRVVIEHPELGTRRSAPRHFRVD